jgi:hypothetical protein
MRGDCAAGGPDVELVWRTVGGGHRSLVCATGRRTQRYRNQTTGEIHPSYTRPRDPRQIVYLAGPQDREMTDEEAEQLGGALFDALAELRRPSTAR